MPRKVNPKDGYSKKPKYKTSDLRYPIALLKMEQKPDLTDVSWHLTVKPYATPFAAFMEGRTRPSRGDEAESKAQHTFAIREDVSILIEVADFVVFEDTLYTINSLNTERGARVFTEIFTTVYSKISTSGVVLDDTIAVPTPTDKNNPFFTD